MPERVSLPLPPLGVWKDNWGWVDSKHLSLEQYAGLMERELGAGVADEKGRSG